LNSGSGVVVGSLGTGVGRGAGEKDQSNRAKASAVKAKCDPLNLHSSDCSGLVQVDDHASSMQTVCLPLFLVLATD
jgi:hypothetical protein